MAGGNDGSKRKKKGVLILSGGNEPDDSIVLKEIAEWCKERDEKLVIISAPSAVPEETGPAHVEVFKKLSVKNIEWIDVRIREEADKTDLVRRLDGVCAVFFTGGDQLRLTASIGDTPLYQRIREIYLEEGGLIGGTSAGTAGIPETMLIAGGADETPEMSSLKMAPGLGLMTGVIIDSHFAERGRIGRLAGVVAQNGANVGIGIDEDTAIVVENSHFKVIGSGGVYIVDGKDINYSSLSDEQRPKGILSIYNLKMHVLGHGDHYDLVKREPIITAKERAGKGKERQQSSTQDAEKKEKAAK